MYKGRGLGDVTSYCRYEVTVPCPKPPRRRQYPEITPKSVLYSGISSNKVSLTTCRYLYIQN